MHVCNGGGTHRWTPNRSKPVTSSSSAPSSAPPSESSESRVSAWVRLGAGAGEEELLRELMGSRCLGSGKGGTLNSVSGASGRRIVNETFEEGCAAIESPGAVVGGGEKRGGVGRLFESLFVMSTLIRAFRSTHLRTPTHARIRTSVIAPGTSIRRAFVSSAQARAAAAVLSAPTQEAIDAEEIDVQLTPPHEARIELTDRAAEVRLSLTLRRLICNMHWRGTATAHHRSARAEPGCGAAHRGRVGRVPWLPVQDGARHCAQAR